jgi:hypothetical protein
MAEALDRAHRKGIIHRDWSPDGTWLLINYWQGGTRREFFSAAALHRGFTGANPASRGDAEPLCSRWKWVAYSDLHHREVYTGGLSSVGTFSDGRWQVSTTGGLDPQWRGDGRQLFYFSGTTLTAVEVKLDGPSFQAGPPRALFKVQLPPQPHNTRYAANRDGQRFLINRLLDQPSESIDVLVNGLPAQP